MFIERKVNQATNKVELWECEWEYPEGAPAKKIFVSKIGEEQFRAVILDGKTLERKDVLQAMFKRTIT